MSRSTPVARAKKRGFAVHMARVCLVFLLLLPLSPAAAQTCLTADDMEAAQRAALEQAARQFFQMAARGDVAAMQQNSIVSLASNFSPVATAVRDSQPLFTGAQATTRAAYLLEAPGTTVIPRAEFFCGVFNSPDRVGFELLNLPPGKYAMVIEGLSGGKTPGTVSLILQQESGQWKLAGFYAKPNLIAGHDADWFLNQARQYKTEGEYHNAWFYYLAARDLLAPVAFMSTPRLDKLYDEAQQVKPADMPPSAPLTLAAGGRTYNVTQVFAVPVAEGLDLVVRYQAAEISNQAQTWANSMALIQALVARFPEFRQAFAGVMARAVDPAGKDFVTLVAMKDVK